MATTAEMIKELRAATGAGVLDCKKALDENGGDLGQAAEYLRQKGLAAAAKKSSREAHQGLIGSYIHMGAQIAALVEVNCETDFVARTDDFQNLSRDLAMQVVAAKPLFVRREDVPADVLAEERAKYQAEATDTGKPDHVLNRIIEGKLEKYLQSVILLEQPFIRDENMTVGQLVTEAISRLGENIVVRRFVRYEIGQ